MDIAFHPAASLFREMSPEEFEILKEDLSANGQKIPIETLGGSILDGRHRFKACTVLGIKPKFHALPDDTNPEKYVVSANLARRHLSDAERAIKAAKMANRKRGGNQSNGPIGPLVSQPEAAELFKVPDRTVKRAAAVVTNGTPELVEMVETKKVSLSAAEEVSALPKVEQKKVVEAGPKAVKGKAKEMREDAKAKNGEAGDNWTQLMNKVYRLTSSIKHWGGIEAVARGWTKKNKIGAVQSLQETIATFEKYISVLEGEMK